jgi:hypothetical protein
MPMSAEQILAAPHGFVWKFNAGDGLMRVSGSDVASDSVSWSRFWLLGVVPVARAGGNPDHSRSAFGRYVAEAVFFGRPLRCCLVTMFDGSRLPLQPRA